MKTNQQRTIEDGIATLVWAAGTNSRDHGFHEDWPVEGYPTVTKTGEPGHGVTPDQVADYQRQLGLAVTEKLALIHEEVSEALGEIRDGHAPTETYYTRTTKGSTGEVVTRFSEQKWDTDGVGTIPMRKPEGFGIELADAMIRIADLAYLTGIDLGARVIEKAAYNATRPHKHGRKF